MTNPVKRAPLADAEAAVCKRLKLARVISGMTQADLAKVVGITRVRLASYEQSRAPVRADIALRICSELRTNEEWLATGKGSPWGSWGLEPTRFSRAFKVDSTFLEFFQQYLIGEIDRLRPEVLKAPGRQLAANTRDEIRVLCAQWLRRVPDDLLDTYRDEMLTAAFLFFVDHDIDPGQPDVGNRRPRSVKL